MSAWLSKHKKSELQDMADQVGVRYINSTNKPELQDALEQHLRSNASSLSKNPTFEPYYNTARANSPVKREANESTAVAGGPSDSEGAVLKRPKRRQTNVGAALDTAQETANNVISKARTPRAVKNAADHITIPSSPQAALDLFDRGASSVTTNFNNFIDRTGVSEYLTSTRETLSSTNAITTLFLLVEAVAMLRALVPYREAFSIPLPGAGLIGLDSPVWVSLPDFFVFFTSAFWAPMGLWLGVSILAPALFSWLFNLSRAATSSSSSSHSSSRRHVAAAATQTGFDPVVFNIVRGCGAWLIFEQKWGQGGLVQVGSEVLAKGTVWRAGWISPMTAGLVDGTLWGGVKGLVVECGVGVVAGLYEAVLRK